MVYYTSNVDICDRPTLLSVSNTDVDANTVNYYTLGKAEVQSHITRITGIPSITPTQRSALADLKRVLADIDSLPFKNTCKLEMASLKESQRHPRKTLTDYDGTDRRGDPLHWAFCYYPTAADTTPNDGRRIPAAIRNSNTFKRVFEDSSTDYNHESGTHRRYDMKSLYNDDLLNVHCMLYENRILEGGSSVSAFANTLMMEYILNESDVSALSQATSGGSNIKLTILRMRPVRIQGGVLVEETNAQKIKLTYLRLIELIRTQNAFMHRQKTYNPTLYKLLFHLCSASSTALTASQTTLPVIYDKYIQLMVPKPLNIPITQILKYKPDVAANQTQIYDFYTQPPMGDISDMTFNITGLDCKMLDIKKEECGKTQT
jgi:hypothetical protein